ncbi:uncharacterized protein AMSG_03180 [Thecamonas trahens ATCC 50062]|uniref:Uncharacterized protein n=1 Tax=Thecamonas trahens ATCC 50062 TaxID=461836 RepID=A0A0L0D3L8_THETB|nr:hypothetical protein AMSG_03180 [Thecamonas trahens ATCC 50062]KNC46751.1 hypothetical protein AMSG_03180 [Thecamonas trahens ATCC 50062]|eukprot:XP_013760031.1 hypothetical protein AMSG_03180 [Thecamonas trahens ATCC 50062]
MVLGAAGLFGYRYYTSQQTGTGGTSSTTAGSYSELLPGDAVGEAVDVELEAVDPVEDANLWIDVDDDDWE